MYPTLTRTYKVTITMLQYELHGSYAELFYLSPHLQGKLNKINREQNKNAKQYAIDN